VATRTVKTLRPTRRGCQFQKADPGDGLRLGGERRGEEAPRQGADERSSIHTGLRLADYDGTGTRPGTSKLHQRAHARTTIYSQLPPPAVTLHVTAEV